MTAESFSDELRHSAAAFAQSALRAHLAGDRPVFLLHSATALEQLCKAYLASVHPSLIAGNDFDSLLHLCGSSSHSRTPPARMKTIGAQDALARAGQLVAPLENLRKSLQVLIWIRNGVVHAGQIEPDAAVLAPFLRACDYLLAEIDTADRAAFWGQSLDIVDARLSESTNAAKVRAADAVAAARARFTERYADIEATLARTLIATVEKTYAPERYAQTLWTCPACENRALVIGSYDVEWEPDWDYSDGEAWIAGAYPTVTFSPGTLECRVCGLILDGEDELQAAEIPGSWQLDPDDINVADFYEHEWE